MRHYHCVVALLKAVRHRWLKFKHVQRGLERRLLLQMSHKVSLIDARPPCGVHYYRVGLHQFEGVFVD